MAGFNPVSQPTGHISRNSTTVGTPSEGSSGRDPRCVTVQYFAVRRDETLLETMAVRLFFLFYSKPVLLSTFMHPVISIVHKLQALHCPFVGFTVLCVPPCSLIHFHSLLSSGHVIVTDLCVLTYRRVGLLKPFSNYVLILK
jgi:hypothetical protein